MRFALLKKGIACCLAIMLAAPASPAFALQNPAPQYGSHPQTTATVPGDAPAAPMPAQNMAQNTAERAQNPATQRPANRPVGTAVAPYEKASGVTASRPTGAVIAPAKQRRMRTILIRIGVVVGAAAAVGAVVALSHASPSRPQ